MAKIQHFEDLECWKLSRQLTVSIYKLCEPVPLSRDNTLSKQMKRAAISVMNNIAEGFTRYSNKEFIRFLEIANGSAAEIKSMLYLLIDLNYYSQEEMDALFQLQHSIQIKIRAFIRYLKSRHTPQPKHPNT